MSSQNERLEVTQRIRHLKERYDSLSWGISSKRAVLFTESWISTEGEPVIIRRAKGFKHVLENIPVNIWPDELIVGCSAERERMGPLFPEMDSDWLEVELLNSSEHSELDLSEADLNALRQILPYWKGKSLKDHILKGLSQRTLDAREDALFNISMHEDSGLGHLICDYETVLVNGLRTVKKQYKEKLAECEPCVPEDYNRMLFYESALIHLDAISLFIYRYAEKARKMAEAEKDSIRADELSTIAGNLINISENPAQTFHEALQLVWFVQMLIQMETNGSSVSIGRFDRFMFPFYKKDVTDGILTPAGAQELVDCFYIKLAGIFKARPAARKSLQSGITRYQDLTIGGQDEMGRDITNDLTYICMTARLHCNTVDPQLSLRVHNGTPTALLKRAAEVIKSGGGHPALYSDEVIIPSLLYRGVPLHRARDYSIIGCVEIAFLGLWGRNDGGYVNIPKVLELALDDVVGKQHRGKFKSINEIGLVETFEDFYKHFEYVLEDVVKNQTIENNLIDMIHENLFPHVMCSLFTPGCLESGRDVTSGGAEMNWTTPLGVGLANTANALYSINRLVFEEKKLTLAELWDILDKDWEGHETMRQTLLRYPKYGNDEDEVDEFAAKVANSFYKVVEKQRNHRDSGYYPAMYSLTSNVPLGWATAATADGRNAGTPLAEGISPTHGTDVNGPTAVLKSVGKVDWLPATGGIILNQKFNPGLLKDEKETQRFIELIRTYLNVLQGAQVQFNIVSKEELLAAQADPEAYKNLIIRVTGYSARFTELSKAVQDDIIARTEHMHF